MLRVSERREPHGQRIPEICREAAECSYGSRPVHLFKENYLRPEKDLSERIGILSGTGFYTRFEINYNHTSESRKSHNSLDV